MKKTVILAMSGGVDSSAALSLLIERGDIVKGVTMQNGYLSSEELSKAEQVAKKFNVDWEILSVEKEFEDKVINPFIDDYNKGLTPNPCAICNKTIKFGFLFDIMQKRYPDLFYATGHYAIITKERDSFFIKEARDTRKDQSYFLGMIRPEILPRLIFPVGDYLKTEVIEYAKKRGIISGHVSESQDICFIQDNDYKSFLISNGIKEKKGEIIHENGELLGFHNGIFNYTIGQRRGLGISYTEKLFVKEIIPETNTIVLASLKNMHSKVLRASNLNRFITSEQIFDFSKKMLKCKVKSGSQKFDCDIKMQEGEMRVFFKEDIFAVTPGQLCVIYNDEGLIVLSGIIEKNIDQKNGTII
jgi:tRNA-specific 2-thiouridylase